MTAARATGAPFHAARATRLRRPIDWPVTLCAYASVAALFFISNLMMASLGLAYETAGGAQWEKIAPATYFAFAGLFALIATRPNLAAFADEIVRRHKGLIVFFICWAGLFAYIVKFHGSPLTATFDTFLLPMALFLILPRTPGKAQRRMALFLHAFMALNALIGLAEFAIGFRLTPIMAQGIEITSDYRSSALLGHPLNNAAMAACYGLILMLGGGRDLSPGWRTAALLLQLPALAVFGGRFATVAFLGFAAVIAGKRALDIFAGRRFSTSAAAAMLIIVPVMVVGTILLVTGGFLDKFLMRFVEDDGSAASRLIMFELIGKIPFTDLLVGANPDVVSSLQRTEGIAFGIESFWVAFIAYYGILISVPFFVGLIAFLVGLARQCAPKSGWAILLFILICSTSASLSGKSTSFGQFTAMLMLLMRPLPLLPKQGRA